jgi:hypothetical protein
MEKLDFASFIATQVTIIDVAPMRGDEKLTRKVGAALTQSVLEENCTPK